MQNLGKYGSLRLEQLQQNRPQEFQSLSQRGELEQHCRQVDAQAREMKAKLLSELNAQQPNASPEQREMLSRQAEEIVLHDLVNAPDPETEKAEREGYTD